MPTTPFTQPEPTAPAAGQQTPAGQALAAFWAGQDGQRLLSLVADIVASAATRRIASAAATSAPAATSAAHEPAERQTWTNLDKPRSGAGILVTY